MKVALYFRVSTGEQTVEPQRLELLEYCRRRGWVQGSGNLVTEYADQVSGTRFTRSGLDSLMADVRRGKVDTVCCVKLDRIGRSLPHLAQLVTELEKHGVALICTTQGIDTSIDSPCGRFQLAVLMAVAQFERDLIRERTKAGLVAAKARGSKLGRPRFKMTPQREAILRGWKRTPNDRRVYVDLADALGCSIGKAHALANKKEPAWV